MSALGVRILLAANRFLPRPALPGRAEPHDYADWEYRTSLPVVLLWRRAGGGPVRRALDLGCGLGGKTRRLVEEGGSAVRWTALDIALEHLRHAAAYHRSRGVDGVGKVVADAVRLPFPSASFDRIVTTDTLEHFPAPRDALGEMRRCLRPDGRLLLLFNPWGSPRGSHLGDLLHVPWCQLLFSPHTLGEAALAAGEARARAAPTPEEAARIRSFAAGLVDHFRHHVHPTRISQLRSWLRQDRIFSLESELHVGPGPLRRAPFLRSPLLEEWLTASYGAVLRPADAPGSA